MRVFGLKFALISILCMALTTAWIYAVITEHDLIPVVWVVHEAKKATLIGCCIVVLTYFYVLYRLFLNRADRPVIVTLGLIFLLFLPTSIVIIRVLFLEILDYSSSPYNVYIIASAIMPILVALGIPYAFYQFKKLRETPTYRQWFLEGRGGSAEWAGPASHRSRQIELDGHMEWPLGSLNGVLSKEIFLGRSQFDDDPFSRLVGINDDSHMLTIGSTGSGKSVTTIWPNLAMYQGSVIVFDPKGEHARMTYGRRSAEYWTQQNGFKTQTQKRFPTGECFMLDPFGVNKDYGIPGHCFNPLSEIDVHSDNAREKIAAIADGCVNPESNENKHFEEWARDLIQGLIIHVLSRYTQDKHNLPFILDLFHGFDPQTKFSDPQLFKDLLIEMMMNDACGGLAQQVAAKLSDMGDREMGSVLSTVARSLKWIGDPAMRRHLVKSDILFSEIGKVNRSQFDGTTIEAPKTVYIVLPDGQIKEQMRWVRTLISIGIVTMQQRPIREVSETPTLFILDEFPKLGGKIEAISEGFAILRSYRIKLWPFLQDIGQLQRDYPERWSSITANATLQIFGVRDVVTAEWVSQNLGVSLHARKESRKGLGGLVGRRVVSESVYSLLTPDEVQNKLGKASNVQIVRGEGLPMRLTRLAFKPMSIGNTHFSELPYEGLRGHFEEW